MLAMALLVLWEHGSQSSEHQRVCQDIKRVNPSVWIYQNSYLTLMPRLQVDNSISILLHTYDKTLASFAASLCVEHERP